jgi:HAD superfamily hydrolase (TIGR01549 family)
LVKIILFDLDGTLYDYEKAQQEGLIKAYNFWKKHEQKSSFNEFNKLYSDSRGWIKKFLADTAASHSRALYFQKFVETTTGSPNTDLITELNDAYYDGFFKTMKPFPNLLDTLKKLKNLDYKLGIVTNMQANVQYKKLSILGIGDVFDCIVTSEAVGHEKPNPLIFSHTLSLMKGTPENTFMVGDSFKNDIEPAAFIGIKPIWFNPMWDGSKISEEFKFQVISNYSELLLKIKVY